MSVDELKTRGNDAFREKRYREAVEFYSAALDLDTQNHVLYSNRSASFASLGQHDKALEDAESAVELSPRWPTVSSLFERTTF